MAWEWWRGLRDPKNVKSCLQGRGARERGEVQPGELLGGQDKVLAEHLIGIIRIRGDQGANCDIFDLFQVGNQFIIRGPERGGNFRIAIGFGVIQD